MSPWLYKVATRCSLEDGEFVCFWMDWWLWDGRLEDLMPNLYALVRRSAWLKTVRQAMTEGWWHDISPDMPAQALLEFVALVDRMPDVVLT